MIQKFTIFFNTFQIDKRSKEKPQKTSKKIFKKEILVDIKNRIKIEEIYSNYLHKYI